MTPPYHDDQQDTVRVDRNDPPDAGIGMMARARQVRTVGSMLRAEREGLGVELAQVADQLRIRLPYLVAIEDGQYGALPGPTYVVGFVRTYAEYLGLDPQDVIARFRQEVSGLDARPDLAFPVPVTRRSVPGGAILVTALILAICGYGTWYYLSTGQRPRQEQVAAVPSRLLDLLPEAAKSPNEPVGQNETVAPPLTPPASIAPVAVPTAQSSTQAAGARAAAGGPVASAAPAPPGRPPMGGAGQTAAVPQTVSVMSAPPTPSTSTPSMPAPPAASVNPATAASPLALPASAPRELTQAQLNQAQLDLLNRTTRPAPPTQTPPLPASPTSVVPPQVAAAPPTAPAFGGMQQSPATQPAFQTPPAISESATTQSLNQQQLTQASTRPAIAAPASSASGGAARVTIHASADSWVQLRDGNQRVIIARMLKAGETLRVPDQSGMTLRTGNAGGLDIAVDGRPVQSIGATGVVRSVTLEPQKLMSGDAGQE